MSSKLMLETVLERKYSKTWLARPTFVSIKSGRISGLVLIVNLLMKKLAINIVP